MATADNTGSSARTSHDVREANPTGADVMTAGAVVFLIATFLSWITNQDDESFGGYEADSLIAFTAYLGIGFAIALIMAAQRSERRIQHRGLSFASMAAGVAALGLALSYLIDVPGAAERGSSMEWSSEIGVYVALVGALLWVIGSFMLAREPEGHIGQDHNTHR